MPLTDEAADKLAYELRWPGPVRILYVADAFRAGWTLQQVFDATRIDPWFLSQIEDLLREEKQLATQGFDSLELPRLRALKRKGFSDARIARLVSRDEPAIRSRRRKLGLHPVFKRVDTCAARIPHLDRLPVFDLRGGMRGESQLAAQDHDPGRRSEPHRSGHRIRLLLRACGDGAARGRLRDHHGQLQSGNRVDRLRHLRPAVLRAPHVRRRHGDHREGKARGGDRAVRRTDAAQIVAGARRGGRTDHRHDPRQHRHCRGSRAVPAAGEQSEAQAARQRHGARRGTGGHHGARSRLSAHCAAELRARRARHGSRLQ